MIVIRQFINHTKFTILLPKSYQQNHEQNIDKSNINQGLKCNPIASAKSILLVEDEAMIRKFLVKSLKMNDFKVKDYANAKDKLTQVYLVIFLSAIYLVNFCNR